MNTKTTLIAGMIIGGATVGAWDMAIAPQAVVAQAVQTEPSGFLVAHCYSFNDEKQVWDRLRNPADFVPPAASQGKP